MLSRRSFLSALCALPFVGKFIPKAEPKWFIAYEPQQFWYNVDTVPVPFEPYDPSKHILITSGGEGYVFDDDETIRRLIAFRDKTMDDAIREAFTPRS